MGNQFLDISLIEGCFVRLNYSFDPISGIYRHGARVLRLDREWRGVPTKHGNGKYDDSKHLGFLGIFQVGGFVGSKTDEKIILGRKVHFGRLPLPRNKFFVMAPIETG